MTLQLIVNNSKNNQIQIPIKTIDLTDRKQDGANKFWFKPKLSTFPGGELYIKMDENNWYEHKVSVVSRLENSDDIVRLMLLKNILEKENVEIDRLLVPYIAYGRQDRAVRNGEAFSLKVMASILNDIIKPQHILTLDPHSEVTSALMNCNVFDVAQNIVSKIKDIHPYDYVVIPDAGAEKRCRKYLPDAKFIQCLKQRDFSDEKGAVDKVVVCNPENIEGKRLLILDDICSGGATFIKLAEELSKFNPKQINLYVTHGIFNNGFRRLYVAGIDNIITTNSRREIEDIVAVKNNDTIFKGITVYDFFSYDVILGGKK